MDLADEQVIEIMAAARGQDDDQIEQIAVSGSNIPSLVNLLSHIMRRLEQSSKSAAVMRLYPKGSDAKRVSPEVYPDWFVTAWRDELSSISSTLMGGKRPGNKIINYIRKKRDPDSLWSVLEGPIYAPFIDHQRAAIIALAVELEDCDYLLSLERGGALVADQIALGQPILKHKINKRTLSPEEIERLSAKSADNYKVQQQADLTAKINELMQKHSGGPVTITIAIAETMVGGGSANDLLHTLSKIMANYAQLNIKLLLLEQTMHRENRKGKRSQRRGKRILERRLSKVLPANRMRVIIASTKYILGEDVDYQLAPNSKRPLIVFQKSENDLIIYQITPLGDTTSREILIDLVDGAYSGQLPGIL
ncbi:MAG: hypothetical protein ACPGWR_15985 [Ardenticatenaceae bacterium]